MDQDDLSLIIYNFPFPPSDYPKPCIHEKCIDNPIHDPYLFEKTVSEYFSKLDIEENEKDLVKMEIKVNSGNKSKVLEKSNLRKEMSLPDQLENNMNDNMSGNINNSNSKIERRKSSVVFPFEKIKIDNDSTGRRSSVYSLHRGTSKSNPSLFEYNKNIWRTSLQKIKFHKSKSMNNIKNQNDFFNKEKFGKERSLFREISSDLKRMFSNHGLHKEESKNFLSSKQNSYINNNIDIIYTDNSNNSINNNNKKQLQDIHNKETEILILENIPNTSSTSNKIENNETVINEKPENPLGKNTNNKTENYSVDNKIIYEKSKLQPINSTNTNKINNNLNNDIPVLNKKEEINTEKTNNNDDIPPVKSKEKQIVDQEKASSGNKDNQEDGNENINTSLYELERCNKEEKIETSRKSILTNKSKSITLVAPIASISLDKKASDKEILNTDTKSNNNIDNNSSNNKNTNSDNNNEYNKEYIRQISNQRIERYRLNNGFVRDRIQKFKSNEELLKRPIKASFIKSSNNNNNNNSNNNSNNNISTSKESLNSIENSIISDDLPLNQSQNSIDSKLKLLNSNNDLPIFKKFRDKDDVIKEKITVLNMTSHIETPSNMSQLTHNVGNKENDLLENMDVLKQGILGTLPINKKDKLREFLTNLDDDNINNYQQQIHEEYYEQFKLNNIENKYVKVNKYSLNFGFSKKKIPIEDEVQDSLIIEFKGQNLSYSIDYINKDQNYILNISPTSGNLPNSGTQEITFSLICKTTINKSIVVPLLIDDKYHFIVLRIKSQNSCFGVNIKNCEMNPDSIFLSNQYNIPKILKTYRELLILNKAYNNGWNIFDNNQNNEEVIKIKKQIINNEPVTSKDIYSIAHLFKNWFCELPRKLLYQINQQELLNDINFDKFNDEITGLERVTFSWLIDCFIEMQNHLPNKDDIHNIVKLFVPGLYNIHYEENTDKYNTTITNLELFINHLIEKRKNSL